MLLSSSTSEHRSLQKMSNAACIQRISATHHDISPPCEWPAQAASSTENFSAPLAICSAFNVPLPTASDTVNVIRDSAGGRTRDISDGNTMKTGVYITGPPKSSLYVSVSTDQKQINSVLVK